MRPSALRDWERSSVTRKTWAVERVALASELGRAALATRGPSPTSAPAVPPCDSAGTGERVASEMFEPPPAMCIEIRIFLEPSSLRSISRLDLPTACPSVSKVVAPMFSMMDGILSITPDSAEAIDAGKLQTPNVSKAKDMSRKARCGDRRCSECERSGDCWRRGAATGATGVAGIRCADGMGDGE